VDARWRGNSGGRGGLGKPGGGCHVKVILWLPWLRATIPPHPSDRLQVGGAV